jgi:superfamily II DNA/RNA helicase
MPSADKPSREDLATQYFDQLPFDPYPVQEEALLAWFTSDQGVLVCAPTGTGKTLIAEAALFEALHRGEKAYYTTPLIALTDQKFQEIQEAAVRWGFSADDIGLVTGNRKVNAGAKVLVVVAEILLNRLLHPDAFEFDDVASVVMDEFHNFSDRERGIVWELSLGMLPVNVRLLLLSATVGNSVEFVNWLAYSHKRKLELVHGTQRKVPLSYRWVGDQLLAEFIEEIAAGDETRRRTPALIFCFNRDECWTTAELLKGKKVIDKETQATLSTELEAFDFSTGVGPKLRSLLLRGVGVHHAGLLPKYRRVVEELFQRKLLTICVCTETLAAGINLPARSVILPTIVKGPPDKRTVIEASAAHQIFGRAGRPQFDTEGFVYVLAHEDDVKIARWREKFEQIPENTKDPGLLRARKQLKKKMPKRRTGFTYWTEGQFDKLREAPPGKLSSRGSLPWRLLAYLLKLTPEVDEIRSLIRKRLHDAARLEQDQNQLDQMMLVLHRGGYVELEPRPPHVERKSPAELRAEKEAGQVAEPAEGEPLKIKSWLSDVAADFFDDDDSVEIESAAEEQDERSDSGGDGTGEKQKYRPVLARPTAKLDMIPKIRSINPLYAAFLMEHLGLADEAERIQVIESVLEMPGTVARLVRVPKFDYMPPGPLATGRIDQRLLTLGLVSAEELRPPQTEEEQEEHDRRRQHTFEESPKWILTLADKLKILFNFEMPGAGNIRITPVWSAGEVLEFAEFNKYITSKGLQKQEGIIFRHLLRLILLCGEMEQLDPADGTVEGWSESMWSIADRLTVICRGVDPRSTDEVLEQSKVIDEGEER